MIDLLKNNNCYFSNNLINFCKSQKLNGSSILFVSNSVLKSNKIDGFISYLKKNNTLEIHNNINSNPSLNDVNKFLKSHKKDFNNIFAIGGGSIIDFAKIYRIRSLLGSNMIFLSKNINRSNLNQKTTFIAIPTTCGTGSEITQFATIWDFENMKKLSYENKLMLPNKVILSSDLLKSLRGEALLFPILDALTHCYDSIWNKNSNTKLRNFTFRIANIINKNLKKLIINENDMYAKKRILFASCMSGKVISITKTSICHSISYPLTLKFKVPHGLATSFSLSNLLNTYKNSICKTSFHRNVVDESIDLLRTINLDNLIKKYLSVSELLSLETYMNEPSRLENFLFRNYKLRDFLLK